MTSSMACEALAVGLSVGGKTLEEPMVNVCSGVLLFVDDGAVVLVDPHAASMSAALATSAVVCARCRSERAISSPLVIEPLLGVTIAYPTTTSSDQGSFGDYFALLHDGRAEEERSYAGGNYRYQLSSLLVMVSSPFRPVVAVPSAATATVALLALGSSITSEREEHLGGAPMREMLCRRLRIGRLRPADASSYVIERRMSPVL